MNIEFETELRDVKVIVNASVRTDDEGWPEVYIHKVRLPYAPYEMFPSEDQSPLESLEYDYLEQEAINASSSF